MSWRCGNVFSEWTNARKAVLISAGCEWKLTGKIHGKADKRPDNWKLFELTCSIGGRLATPAGLNVFCNHFYSPMYVALIFDTCDRRPSDQPLKRRAPLRTLH